MKLKSYESIREEKIIVNRVLRDDPSKSDMHNRQGLSIKMIWKVLVDWQMWPLYILGLTHMSKFLVSLLPRSLDLKAARSSGDPATDLPDTLAS